MAQSSTSAARMAQRAERTVRGPGTILLARLGYLMKGVVYLIVGLFAARVAIGDGGKTTDNTGALQAIYHQPFGQFLLGIVVVGLVGYALWSFLRAFLDADGQGSDAKGMVARLGYAAIGAAYASLAYGGIRLLMGAGSTGKSTDANTQDWTARLLDHAYGPVLVVIAGLVVVVIALYLFYYAYSAQFMRYFTGISGSMREWVRRLGGIGYGAQGVVFAEIGIFLIVAASQHNAHEAKGIGGALQRLVREPYGHWLLALVALGFIAYGLYSFAQARYRRVAASIQPVDDFRAKHSRVVPAESSTALDGPDDCLRAVAVLQQYVLRLLIGASLAERTERACSS